MMTITHSSNKPLCYFLLDKFTMLTIILQFSIVFTTSTSSSGPFTHPDFQIFYVNQSLSLPRTYIDKPSNPEIPQIQNKTAVDKKMYTVKLIPRDTIENVPSKSASFRRRFQRRMERDSRRVANIIHHLNRSSVINLSLNDLNTGTEVVPGMELETNEYFVRIGVGSPPRYQYLVVDTGSDLIWVQCQPCIQCYKQSDPVFDPATSASFSGVPCSSSVCDYLEKRGCDAGLCQYEMMYGDHSFSQGTLAFETQTFGPTVIRNMVIGCGHRNHGSFVGASGLLGLGGGTMSFVGQLGGQVGGAYSYCLPTWSHFSSGFLEVGRSLFPVGAAWAPLVHNPKAPSFYYIGLSGLGVGGKRVPLPEDVFRLPKSEYSGVIIDTGTAVTRFPISAYTVLRDAFIALTTNLPRAPGSHIFDTCYNLSGFEYVQVPTVSFYLTGGPILTFAATNFLIQVHDARTYCFAFASTKSGVSIIGNIQQEGIQISIDVANGYVGFGPKTC